MAMATQQQKPMKMGLPPVFTSFTMSVFRPMAAMAMTMKNLLALFRKLTKPTGMGSSVVMEYYEQFGDEHLKKIGVIDSALYPFSPEPWNSHSLAGFNMDAMTATLENAFSHHDDYVRAFTRLCFHTPPCQEDEDWVSTEMKKLPVYIAFALYNDFLFKDYTVTLPKIDIPLLLCCADSPAIPRGIEMGRYYRDLVNGNCYFHEFLNLGHVMFLEDPEQFNETILDFVENYTRA